MTALGDQPDSLVRKLRRLGVNSSVYFLANILLQALQFFLVPLYTRYLTPADYGILTVANTVISLGSLLFGGFLAGAISRVYFNAQTEDELRRLIGTLTLFLLVASLLIVTSVDLLALHTRLGTLLTIGYRPYLRMALWTGYGTMFITVVTAIYTAAQQPVRASVFTIANTLATIILSLMLVVYLRQGAFGNLLAQMLAAAACGGASIILLVSQGRLQFSRPVLVESLRYSFPFVPHLVANWAINLSDRFILQSRVSISDLGIYSLGCQIAGIAMVAASAINSALGPLLLQQLRDKHLGHVRLLGTYGLLAMTFCCLGTALLGGEAIRLLTPAPFHAAAAIVPWVVGAYAFQGVYFVWSTGTWFSMRTALVPVCTLAAAVTNVGLNILLVPRYGIQAAAFTTLVAYAVLMVSHGILATRLHPIDWEYGRWLAMFALACVCFLVGTTLSWGNLACSIAAKCLILFVGFPALLVVSGFVRAVEWQELRASLAELRAR